MGPNRNKTIQMFRILQDSIPFAAAFIRGSESFPELSGTVSFFDLPEGTLVTASVKGLPVPAEPCGNTVFGFHIHEGTQCSGNAEDPFADAKGHFNPDNCPHPEHAGDLPPLFSNQGNAWYAVLTNRFTINDILGRAVIVHSMADDFTTQPSGNSGQKIGCGIIQRV